jgi:hypothetical protein
LIVFAMLLGACHRRSMTPPPASPQPSRQPARPTPAPPPSGPAAVTSAPTLVRAIRDLYAESWYHTLTFKQRTTLVSPTTGRTTTQTWYEAALLPGRLRIDTDLPARNGVLFRRDSVYGFAGGKLASADTGTNELLVLGFDVYTQPAARSDAELRRLGFDLARFHEGTWQGRPVFVVGALRGDTTSKQFWVDRETLLFVRLLERTARGHSDIRFNKYVKLGKAWIATEVEQYVNGKLSLREEYSDVRGDVPLAEALFEPKQWATAPHWARP